jgi:hypothetical protein
VEENRDGEVPGLSATSICSGRNAGNVGSLFTYTSMIRILLGV